MSGVVYDDPSVFVSTVRSTDPKVYEHFREQYVDPAVLDVEGINAACVRCGALVSKGLIPQHKDWHEAEAIVAYWLSRGVAMAVGQQSAKVASVLDHGIKQLKEEGGTPS